MTGSLYRWPPAAAFGRAVPKTSFYEHANLSPTVREKFVSQIQRITWAYKLAEQTIHLPGDGSVPEIQIFTIDAKNDDVDTDLLTAIDRAVKTPIIFEITRSKGAFRTRMVAAHKQLATGTQRLSPYFTTGWLPLESLRAPLPPAVNLPGLYTQLLAPLMPVAVRADDKLSETVEKVNRVRKLEREISALEKRLRSEPQFNRKIELRRELRDRTAVLNELTNPETQKIEDSTWRS